MKKIFYILILLLLSASVIGIKPLTEVNTGDVGLEIKYPKFETLKKAQDYDFEFHVYNLSNGLAMNEGVTCYFHLYNKLGHHIAELEQSTPSHMYDYGFDIDGNNFTNVGQYYYNIYCNSSTLGGFASSQFEVTHYGISNDHIGFNIIAMIIAMCFMSFIFLYFAFNLNEEHFILKLFLVFFSMITLMGLAKVIFQPYGGMNLLLTIPQFFFYIFALYFIVYIFYHWAKKTEAWAKVFKG